MAPQRAIWRWEHQRAAMIGLLDHTSPRLSVVTRSRFGGSREPEIDLLPRFVSAGDTVVDAGAHRGVYTWHLARLVGAGGRVVAFEPQPHLCRYLQRAFGRWPQVTVDARALSDGAAGAVLTVPRHSGNEISGQATLEGGPGRTVEVTTTPLDALELSPSLIKADVEGHERKVIVGASRTIERNHPVMLLEIARRREHVDDERRSLIALLGDLRYRAVALDPGGGLQTVELGRLTNPEDPIVRTGHPYNFFLLPPEPS
jgi:FkbM family methyltransferase